MFELRLSEDVPSQSDSMPLFNIYFLGCMFFSLFAMIWFFVMSILHDEKKLNRCTRCVVTKFVCPVMFIDNHRIIQVPKKLLAKKIVLPDDLDKISDRIEMETGTIERRVDLTDNEVLDILNRFVFYLFLAFIILLNIICLIIFPYIIQQSNVLPEN